MKVYTCTNHAQHWPVGVASVIVAKDTRQARRLLNAQLKKHGLDPRSTKYTLQELDLTTPAAFVLNDGNY